MPHATKIATCCYCGTRAALVLTGRDRHELACSGCGAPLHELKALKPVKDRKGDRELVRPNAMHPRRRPEPDRRAPKKRKKRKSTLRWFLEEAFDAVEDIFD